MRQTLAGLPAFLRYLGSFPPPDRVVEALARGPLAHCGAATAMVWQAGDDDLLHGVGAYGLSREEVDRYWTIPLAIDLPVARAVREDRLLVDDARTLPRDYLDGLDAHVLGGLVDRTAASVLVDMPIVHAGRTIGAYGFAATRAWDPEGSGPTICAAVASALALWMTHPRAGLDGVAPRPAREWSLAFTSRQREVLLLVESGLSNPAIALALHVSESSVKADLAQVMRALRTSDRREAPRRARALGLL